MKILYLLRHAKAEAGGSTVSDAERPLSARGFEACGDIGDYLKAKHYKPAFAFISPALRTRQTFDCVMQAAGQNPAMRAVNKLYLASEEEIVRIVQGAEDEVASLLVVGHNPGLHHASLSLAEPQHTVLRIQLELKFPTGALTVLRFNCRHWREIAYGKGELIDFMTPGEL